MSAVQEIFVFLIKTLFDLYIALFIIRLLLGVARADFYNPLSQFIVKATNPLLVPLRRFLPAVGKLDTSAIVAAVLLKIAEVLLLMLILGGNLDGQNVAKLVIGDLLRMIVWIYIIALIIQAVISWVGSSHGNPVVPLLNSLTDPILKPVRRFVPPIAMIDLSPLVAILGLQVVLIVLRNLGL